MAVQMDNGFMNPGRVFEDDFTYNEDSTKMTKGSSAKKKQK